MKKGERLSRGNYNKSNGQGTTRPLFINKVKWLCQGTRIKVALGYSSTSVLELGTCQTRVLTMKLEYIAVLLGEWRIVDLQYSCCSILNDER
jgi:hypothetical protein